MLSGCQRAALEYDQAAHVVGQILHPDLHSRVNDADDAHQLATDTGVLVALATEAHDRLTPLLYKEDISSVATRSSRLWVKWWPVGQGLFMSGRLYSAAGGIFDWVYDCGTTDGKIERDNAIGRYRAIGMYRHELESSKRPDIDLVTLSHFDADHINGIVALLKSMTVGWLLLPYAPLWKRLLVAFSEGIAPDNPLFDFYINPAAFLTEAADASLKGIVFVPEAKPGVAAIASDVPVDPDRPVDELEFDFGDPPAEAEGDPLIDAVGKVEPRFLKSGGRIIVPSLWEFVPYNDPGKQAAVTTPFEKWVLKVAGIFCTNQNLRKKALARLKRNYPRWFGSGAENANLISLYLYSGPVGNGFRMRRYGASSPVHFNADRDNFAQLNTGDAYLDDPARLASLQAFYQADRRLERAGLFQVMHHGSAKNWFAGLAAILKPAASIFSSHVPAHGHPDADVLLDFWPWGAARVDKKASFSFWADLIHR